MKKIRNFYDLKSIWFLGLVVTGVIVAVSMASVRGVEACIGKAVCKPGPVSIYLDINGQKNLTPADVNNGSYCSGCTDPPPSPSLTVTVAGHSNTFTCIDVGKTFTVHLDAICKDGGSGCTTTVKVLDNIPPTASCKNITVYLPAAIASIWPEIVDNGSTDNCTTAANLTRTLSKDTFNCSDIGNNTVTLTVTDQSNNSSTCNVTVTVVDNSPPMVSCRDITVYLDASGSVSITPADVDNNSFDKCSFNTNLTRTLSKSSFNCSDIGNNTVTLTVTDQSNNSGTCYPIVTVVDNMNPVVTSCPANITETVPAGTTCKPVSWASPIFSDNCGSVSVSCNHTSGDSFCIMTAPTVTCTGTDGSGNQASCSFDVAITEPSNLIELDQFTAVPQSNQIAIIWSTGSELDNAGFNLWRSESENGEYLKINPAIIEATGDAVSKEYSYIDCTVIPGVTYYYKLEDIDTSSVSTVHGPISTVIPAPQSIYLLNWYQMHTTVPVWWWMYMLYY